MMAYSSQKTPRPRSVVGKQRDGGCFHATSVVKERKRARVINIITGVKSSVRRARCGAVLSVGREARALS